VRGCGSVPHSFRKNDFSDHKYGGLSPLTRDRHFHDGAPPHTLWLLPFLERAQ
jgi:hypothetical protein